MSGITLDHFYGIEIDDFACEIARLSLWLAELQLNQQWEENFGRKIASLPLSASGKIVSGNSLRLNWHSVCPKQPDEEVYVIGNPPFLGHAGRNEQQRNDMRLVLSGIKSAKRGQAMCKVCSLVIRSLAGNRPGGDRPHHGRHYLSLGTG